MNIFITLICAILLLNVEAKEKSVLKIGSGVSFISIPEYIGSSNQKSFLLPYPYIYYKNKNTTIEKNKIFKHLYKKNNVKIDISISGTIPVESRINSLRYGMNNLDPTIEVGPNFIFGVLKNNSSFVNIEFPLRTIWSVNLSNINSLGYNFSPNIYIKYFLNTYFELNIRSGFTFASKKYNNYFYEVKDKYMTQNRDKYQSYSGYTGYKNTFSLLYRNKNILVSSFARYYDLKEVVFKNSPLVSSSYSLFYGMAISYIF
jgi:outer membrane protein